MALLLLLAAAWLAAGILGAAAPPTAEPRWLVLPRDAARLAVEDHNQRSAAPSLSRLFKLRSAHKTRLDWGIHFSLHFTIKETWCPKTAGQRIRDCKYKPDGLMQDCSAEVSFLHLMWDSPLTSMQCVQAKRKKSPPHAGSPQVNVEQYMPASYSTAALTAVEEE